MTTQGPNDQPYLHYLIILQMTTTQGLLPAILAIEVHCIYHFLQLTMDTYKICTIILLLLYRKNSINPPTNVLLL